MFDTTGPPLSLELFSANETFSRDDMLDSLKAPPAATVFLMKELLAMTPTPDEKSNAPPLPSAPLPTKARPLNF